MIEFDLASIDTRAAPGRSFRCLVAPVVPGNAEPFPGIPGSGGATEPPFGPADVRPSRGPEKDGEFIDQGRQDRRQEPVHPENSSFRRRHQPGWPPPAPPRPSGERPALLRIACTPLVDRAKRIEDVLGVGVLQSVELDAARGVPGLDIELFSELGNPFMHQRRSRGHQHISVLSIAE